MFRSGDRQSERMLSPEHARKSPILGARTGFILLFALVNAMFCAVLFLRLQNMKYVEQIAFMEATATRLVVDATTGAGEAMTAIATREFELQQIRSSPMPLPSAASPTGAPDRNPPTSTPEVLLSPTVMPSPTTMPSPTPTRVFPSPTSTPLPPTPVPTPTHKPKPKPTLQPPPTRPPEPPPPTRPPDLTSSS